MADIKIEWNYIYAERKEGVRDSKIHFMASVAISLNS